MTDNTELITAIVTVVINLATVIGYLKARTSYLDKRIDELKHYIDMRINDIILIQNSMFKYIRSNNSKEK